MSALYTIRQQLAEEIDRRVNQLPDLRGEKDKAYQEYQLALTLYERTEKEINELTTAIEKIAWADR
jgi:uncharacterized protein (DUF2225 family)